MEGRSPKKIAAFVAIVVVISGLIAWALISLYTVPPPEEEASAPEEIATAPETSTSTVDIEASTTTAPSGTETTPNPEQKEIK